MSNLIGYKLFKKTIDETAKGLEEELSNSNHSNPLLDKLIDMSWDIHDNRLAKRMEKVSDKLKLGFLNHSEIKHQMDYSNKDKISSITNTFKTDKYDVEMQGVIDKDNSLRLVNGAIKEKNKGTQVGSIGIAEDGNLKINYYHFGAEKQLEYPKFMKVFEKSLDTVPGLEKEYKTAVKSKRLNELTSLDILAERQVEYANKMDAELVLTRNEEQVRAENTLKLKEKLELAQYKKLKKDKSLENDQGVQF